MAQPERSNDYHSGLPESHLIGGLPFFPQIEDQCGPASLATVLAARDVHVQPQSLRGKLYIPGKEGAVTTEMIARARRHGLLVYPLRPELADVLEEVAAGNPVLVMQNLGFSWMPRWHFSVVIGFDRNDNSLIIRSGDTPRRTVGAELFLKTWSRAQHWAVVVVQPQELPATAQRDVFLAAAGELEQVGESQAALAAYTAAVSRWPDSDVALLGAGNTAYALALFERAVAFFTTLIELNPSSAAGWNNLAYSLMQVNCPAASVAAIDCALQLDPTNETFLESRGELIAMLPGQVARGCPSPLCPVP